MPASRHPILSLVPSLSLGAVAGALLLCAACTTTPEEPLPPAAEPAPQATTPAKYVLKDGERFAVLGDVPIVCTGILERISADGRLEIVANFANTAGKPVAVQASCVFADADGFNLVEDSPWQTFTLAPSASITAHFPATQVASKKYTVRVRGAKS